MGDVVRVWQRDMMTGRETARDISIGELSDVVSEIARARAVEETRERIIRTHLGDYEVRVEALVALSLGVRNYLLDVPGLDRGADVAVRPHAPLPNGYLIGTPCAVADGKLSIPVVNPALTIGGGIRFTVAVTIDAPAG
ncbi:hypothetical protein [Profundibacterium mesophilum]|nr:hypothetical protein [Profundibacterium mesophilum]